MRTYVDLRHVRFVANTGRYDTTGVQSAHRDVTKCTIRYERIENVGFAGLLWAIATIRGSLGSDELVPCCEDGKWHY